MKGFSFRSDSTHRLLLLSWLLRSLWLRISSDVGSITWVCKMIHTIGWKAYQLRYRILNGEHCTLSHCILLSSRWLLLDLETSHLKTMQKQCMSLGLHCYLVFNSDTPWISLEACFKRKHSNKLSSSRSFLSFLFWGKQIKMIVFFRE